MEKNNGQVQHKLITVIKENNIKGLKQYCKEHGDIDIELDFDEGKAKLTGIQYAAEKGLMHILRELLVAGCDINKATHCKWRALHLACSHAKEEVALNMVKELIRHGAEVNYHDSFCPTPLFIASSKGHSSVIHLLCGHGADVNKGFHHWTPLYQAAWEHHLDVVKSLIQHNADINSLADSASNTALHVAASCFLRGRDAGRIYCKRRVSSVDVDIVHYLVNNGSNIDSVNHFREIPIDIALDSLIIIYSLTLDDAARQVQILLEIVQFLVKAGCSIRDCPEEGSRVIRLLQCWEMMFLYGDHTVKKTIQDTVILLLAAGCPVVDKDMQMLKHVNFLDALDMAKKLQLLPQSLTTLCKYTMRDLVHKPLHRYIPTLTLPYTMKNYLLLSEHD